MTQIINQIIFAAANIWMAWCHAKLIRENKPIKHGLWGGGYLAAVLIWTVIFGWVYFFLLLVQRGVLFSPALNLFRRLPINHISSTTTSLIDRLEYKLFKGNWYRRMAWYVAAWIAFTILTTVL